MWDAVGWNGSIALALARWCHGRFATGRWSRTDAFGVSDGEAEQFLAPTAGLLCCGLRTAGVGELDALCVNVNEGGGDVHCEVKARKTEWIRAWLLIGHQLLRMHW